MASPLFLVPLLRRYIVQTKTYKGTQWQEYTDFATLNQVEWKDRDLAAKNPQTQEVRVFDRIAGRSMD